MAAQRAQREARSRGTSAVRERTMPRSPGLFLLLLVLQPLPALGLGLRSAGGRNPECGPCRPERCPEPVRCPVPGIVARDECGCCALCLGAEGASCGGRAGARCGPGLVCASRAAGAAPEGTGLCVCAQRGSVCGSDGRSYPSVCALRLRARQAPRALPGHLHKARDGPCEFGESSFCPAVLGRVKKRDPDPLGSGVKDLLLHSDGQLCPGLSFPYGVSFLTWTVTQGDGGEGCVCGGGGGALRNPHPEPSLTKPLESPVTELVVILVSLLSLLVLKYLLIQLFAGLAYLPPKD